jgi:hypothetical protein
MNEALLRRALELKLNMADRMMAHLPAETSEKIREFEKLIVETVGEHLKNSGNGDPAPAKTPGKINKVEID